MEKFNMKDINNILLFANGIWNKRVTNLERLNRLFNNYQELAKHKLLPSGKITHAATKKIRDQEYPILKNYSPFAFGDLTNLRLEKTDKIHPKLKEPIYKLYGDLKDVPDNVADDWNQRKLKGASIEILPTLELQDGTKFTDVIDAVALLGNEIPALWQAQNYSLENDYSEKCLISDSDISNEKEIAEIYQLIDIENYKNEENETMKLTKEQYAAKIKKFVDKGIKVQSFEAYVTMTQEQETTYFSNLDSDLAKEEYSLVSTETRNLVAELKRERELLSQERAASATGMKESYQNELEEIKKQRGEIATERKEEKVTKLVYSLSKGETSKLPIAIEGLAITALMRADDSPGIEKYSNGVETKDKSDYQVIVDLLSGFPDRPNKSHKEMYKNKDGLEVPQRVIDENPDLDPQQLVDDAAIEKYSLDHKVSYEEAFDTYYGTKSMVMKN